MPTSTLPFDARLGRAICRYRIRAGMTQSNLAVALGLTYQQVQKYEKGINCVTVRRLVDIAAALGVGIHAILAATHEPLVSASTPRQSRQINRLIKIYSSIRTDRLRRHVLELVETFTSPNDEELT
jgi:transcriptional regulator with XRE-family HTH domain